MSSKCKSMRLSSVSFGVSLGFVMGIYCMLFAWAGMWWGYGTELTELYAKAFPGYAATWVGGLAGLAWGFLEGFVFGIVWGWIYNMCMCCCKCCCCSSGKECKTE